MKGEEVIRPADAHEAIEAWSVAISHNEGPTALILSRQSVPVLDRSQGAPATELRRGAYVLVEPDRSPELILIGTGSEVQIAVEAARRLTKSGKAIRVVSMPSWELFEAQAEEYRQSVLPREITKRVSIEAGVTLGWERYVGSSGISIGIDHFGASAPGRELFQRYGLTTENVVEAAIQLLLEEESQ